MSLPKHFVWMDLEMTGLDPVFDRILEIATVITDPQLNIVAKGPAIAIHQSDAVLENMNEWCIKQHNKSGLVKRVQDSTYDEAAAEKETLHFIQKIVAPNISPLCGNSIWQDRRFLRSYMPTLENYFHYRLLDVSSVKILAQHWAPEVAKQVKQSSNHLAMDDILDSIEELKLYKSAFFKGDDTEHA